MIIELFAALALTAGGPSVQDNAASTPSTIESDEVRAERATLVMRAARTEFRRGRALFDQGLLSTAEFEAREVALKQAELSYAEAAIALQGSRWRIRLLSAEKSEQNGEKHLRLTIRAEATSERRQEELVGAFQPQRVYLTVKDTNDVVICRPYEQVVDLMTLDRSLSVEFSLLHDVDEATISWRRSGRLELVKVVLGKDSTQSRVVIDSHHFSQEADLGSEVVYDLRLEGFGDGGRLFRLAALGLPAEVRSEFSDPATNSRLTHVRFSAGSAVTPLNLIVKLPREAMPQAPVDVPLRFCVVAVEATAPLSPIADCEELRRAAAAPRFAGGVRGLELLPRGVPQLTISTPQLYLETRPGETRQLVLTVKNTGTRLFDGARVSVEAPDRWRWACRPPEIGVVAPGREMRVEVDVTVDVTAPVGERELRLHVERSVGNGKVDVDEKLIRVRVQSPRSLWALGALVLLLTATMGVLLWLGVRLGRR